MEATKKTWKREMAFLIFVWFVWIVESKGIGIVELLVWPVFTYIALAFGLQWYAPNGSLLKQSSVASNGWGTERSSQYASREGEHSDYRSIQSAEVRSPEPRSYPETSAGEDYPNSRDSIRTTGPESNESRIT